MVERGARRGRSAAKGSARRADIPAAGTPSGLRLLSLAADVDEATLANVAALGFDAVLARAALWQAPFLAADALDAPPVRASARRVKAHGLAFVLDIDLHRVGAASELARSEPTWFSRAIAPAWPADPRRELHAPEFTVRFDHPAAAAGVTAHFTAQLRDAAAQGVGGFAVSWPQRVPPSVLAEIVAGVRATHPQTRFLAWTPGLSRSERRALIGVGFDACFCSLPWWDYRAPWLVEELEDLRHIGAVIAPIPARVGGDHERDRRALRRALGFARACTDGLLLEPGPSAEKVDNAAFWTGFGEEMTAANRTFDTRVARRTARCVSAPWARVGAWLERDGHEDRLTLVNHDLDHHNTARMCDIERNGGIATGAESIALGPAEVREMVLAAPARVHTEPPEDALKKAIAAPRIAIENVSPCVDDGRFAAKRTLGDTAVVEADVYADGHPVLAVRLLWRAADETEWQTARMRTLGNDRWRGEFPLHKLGCHVFAIEAGIDEFGGLRSDIEKKATARQPVALEIEEAERLIVAAAKRASAERRTRLRGLLRELGGATDPVSRLLAPDCAELMADACAPTFATRSKPYPLVVERLAARYASWYELFPRSQGRAGAHGTFRDVIAALPRIAAMGFDVLYFTPIHPIGKANRKGRNNALTAQPGEPGSPYAIGAAEGGHDAVHPELGTLDDFRALVGAARAHGLEIALDFAVQCSPDHPWIKQHPDWFAWRPDGSLRYAENPPKKYEDIVNVDFYAKGAKPALWTALRDVLAFWMREGVKTFRVDNPHTKPLPFWEWVIADLRSLDPEVVFLSEAFTRPRPMYRLAKLGFSQSYTYFTWRNTRDELASYMTELNAAPVRDFFRPHFFVNTPDINPTFLHASGRAGFLIRAALAATLSGLWGMYSGFELCESAPLPGREEYLDSEKYQLRHRDWNAPGNIAGEIAELNRIRRENPALHSHLGLTFYNCTNSNILYFAKATPTRDNVLLVAVLLDPFHAQQADIELPLWEWGMDDGGALCAEDLLRGDAFDWRGKVQRLRIDPSAPYRIWRVRSERER
ncbi:MAG TPA: alpha-1,4-glucan--maltose-1-phosphate maltosyltransferase [Casimicrobiaceae bacterium]|nr:alpha-1,4-glucan--maltose-1-phosphate maltosyltransferase [Casimicrobiaceae bacterium]